MTQMCKEQISAKESLISELKYEAKNSIFFLLIQYVNSV